MNYYLQSTTEENLYRCIINEIWGATNRKLSEWQPGDLMIAYVDRALAALFEITDTQFYDESQLWPNDLYPYRVPIKLLKIIHPDDRYSISNLDIRESMFRHHTTAYGVAVVLSARPLHPEPAKILMDHIEQSPEWDGFDAARMLDQLLEKQAEEEEAAIEEAIEARPEPIEEEETSLHTQIQYHLAQLGKALHFDVWIPRADQSRSYKGTKLSELSRPELPSLPFSKKVLSVIGNIDVIWLYDDNPVHLFEVEHTTAIYSGLLRMSDLVAMIPTLDIQMYICANEERRAKVRAEVTRPTFQKRNVPLSARCRYIPFEGLLEFIADYEGVLNHLNISVLEALSENIHPVDVDDSQ